MAKIWNKHYGNDSPEKGIGIFFPLQNRFSIFLLGNWDYMANIMLWGNDEKKAIMENEKKIH